MMKRALVVSIAALLVGCTPPASEAPPQTAEIPPPNLASGCNAQASRDMSVVGSQYYLIEAETVGETCAEANATMRIRSRDGVELFSRSYQVNQVSLAFNPNGDRVSIRSDLEAWTENTAESGRTDELPPWPAGAQRPPGFEPAVTRNQYEAARGAQGALFCFPDGGESNACVALAGDTATLLGSLTPERP